MEKEFTKALVKDLEERRLIIVDRIFGKAGESGWHEASKPGS